MQFRVCGQTIPHICRNRLQLEQHRPLPVTSDAKTQKDGQNKQNRNVFPRTLTALWKNLSRNPIISLPSDVQKVVSTDYVLLHKLIFRENVPELQYSVQVHSDLSLTICHSKEKLKTSYIERNISRDSKTNTCSKLSEIIHHLENIEVIELSDQDVIDVIVEKLKDARFEGNNKVNFLAEQLNLLFKRPNARRYSPSMLAMAALLHGVSPACYKQLYNDGFLTLPSPSHLRRLCSAIDIDSMSLTDSAIAYIIARFKKLPERQLS